MEVFEIGKIATSCCALCQLSIQNFHTKEEIKEQLDLLKRQAYVKEWKPKDGKYYGQRACFVIISPGEDKLEQNLIELKFQHVFTFPRRYGYPEGELKMYIIKW